MSDAAAKAEADRLRDLAERVYAFARAEVAKMPAEREPEAIVTTALVHATGMAVADIVGAHADMGRLFACADAAAGQVFNGVSMWHAVRTCRAPEGAPEGATVQ